MKIWVLSMCEIQEGGGDVVPALLFKTKGEAEAQVIHFKETDRYWGCIGWSIDSQTLDV
tara:strand:+ start:1270 stop:1446 length:177 start_codon:yes stop_codon:yes gene_type:complete